MHGSPEVSSKCSPLSKWYNGLPKLVLRITQEQCHDWSIRKHSAHGNIKQYWCSQLLYWGRNHPVLKSIDTIRILYHGSSSCEQGSCCFLWKWAVSLSDTLSHQMGVFVVWSHYECSWISILIDSWPTFYNNWLVSSYEDWQAYRSAEAHGSVDTATATSKALVCNSLKCSGIMANLGCIHFLWLGLLPQGHAHACGYCAEGPYSLTNWPMCSSDGVAFVWAKCNMTVGLPLVFLLSSWNDSCIHRVPFLPTSAYYVA